MNVTPTLLDRKPEMAKKFIQKATANSHGQFRAKAQAAGKSTKEYAEEKQHASGKLGKEARLALTLMGLSHSKTKKRSGAETRKALYGRS